MNDILKHWNKIMPGFEPRESQIKTFEWIQSLPPDKKYLLLEMPVGGGKSPVGLTLSSWLVNGFGSSYILTPQKVLQRQYEESFSKDLLFSMYGKSNYPCTKKNTNCEVGSSIKPKCYDCPQRSAFSKALKSNNLVLNYTLALMYFAYVENVKKRKIIIMDECHNLESQLVDFTTLPITEFRCEKIGIKYNEPKNISMAFDWIKSDYFPSLTTYITRMQDEVDRIEYEMERSSSGRISETDTRIIKEYNAANRHANKLHELVLSTNNQSINESHVLIREKTKFTLKELYGAKAFHNVIKPYGEKFLFMSSTILNKDGFCADLNINPEEAAFLSLESEFKKENRMIIFSPKTKMNYGWDKPERKNDRAKMSKAIKEILELHKDVSGIIHTGSFKLSAWVIRELMHNTTHKVLHHNSTDSMKMNRDDVIAEYIVSVKHEPTVLISPSITEGLDLKDDLGRFAIFAKVPYPSLGDAWIKRRMEISNDWYRRQALKEMIQGSGRICRSHTDWGITYILDESFTYLYNTTKRNVIPTWWNDAVEII